VRERHSQAVTRAPLKIGLRIWLALSVTTWLIGIWFAGGFYIPRPNLQTLLVIYGPWIVPLALVASAWGQRNQIRWAKPAALTLAAIAALLISLGPQHAAAKEKYFNAVLASCQSGAGVGRIQWTDIPSYDAGVQRYVATDAPDQRVIECVRQRAGLLIRQVACPGKAASPAAVSALEVTSGNEHGPGEARFFEVTHFRFTDATTTAKPTDARCPT
jgi:hypothetical protein